MLDETNYNHPILLKGARYVVNMPYQPKMKMYDMVMHNAADGRYRLLLEARLQIEPWVYCNSLTTPPYTGVIDSRVPLSPSMYLQFNISLQFRLQRFRWRLFRNAVSDRFLPIPRGTPWLEAETEKNIVQEILPIRQTHLLICGYVSWNIHNKTPAAYSGLT